MTKSKSQIKREEATKKRTGRGFASMSPAQQREIASRGGKAAHKKGTAHTWNSEEARKAGALGGRVRQSKAR